MSAVVLLGNSSAKTSDGDVHEDKQLTRFEFAREPNSPSIALIASGEGRGRDSRERRERLAALSNEHRPYFLHLEDIRDSWWESHSDDPADWVESDDPALAAAVAAYFGCSVGRPSDWAGPSVHPYDDPLFNNGGDDRPYSAAFGDEIGLSFRGYRAREWDTLFDVDYANARLLMTNAGQDAFFGQHLSTSAQPASFNYGALSASTAAESAANTTLPSEITTAGGGLLRKQMTYAHTTGTSTATLTATWTANGSDSLPVTIAKFGALNASSSGTLGYEKNLSSTATLTTSGDAITITFTLTRS
jgi:hypothetical protein